MAQGLVSHAHIRHSCVEFYRCQKPEVCANHKQHSEHENERPIWRSSAIWAGEQRVLYPAVWVLQELLMLRLFKRRVEQHLVRKRFIAETGLGVDWVREMEGCGKDRSLLGNQNPVAWPAPWQQHQGNSIAPIPPADLRLSTTLPAPDAGPRRWSLTCQMYLAEATRSRWGTEQNNSGQFKGQKDGSVCPRSVFFQV